MFLAEPFTTGLFLERQKKSAKKPQTNIIIAPKTFKT